MLERIEQLIAMVLEKLNEVLKMLEEVTVGADVGVPATYTIDSEGNVKPIGGEEEEEEEEGEETAGEKAIKKSLEEWGFHVGEMHVHDVTKGVTVMEVPYNPPANVSKLIIPWWRVSGDLRSPAFSMGAPNEQQTFQIAGGGLGGQQLGFNVWNEPVAGTVTMTLQDTFQQYCFCLVSVLKQEGKNISPESRVTQSKARNADNAMFTEPTLGVGTGIFMSQVLRTVREVPPEPEPAAYRVGAAVATGSVVSIAPAGVPRLWRAELNVGLAPFGKFLVNVGYLTVSDTKNSEVGAGMLTQGWRPL